MIIWGKDMKMELVRPTIKNGTDIPVNIFKGANLVQECATIKAAAMWLKKDTNSEKISWSPINKGIWFNESYSVNGVTYFFTTAEEAVTRKLAEFKEINKSTAKIRYYTSWNESQTKIIYQATKHTEDLMEILEEALLDSDLVQMIAEKPVPAHKRRYGEMIYYLSAKPKRKLLSSAPRREKNHIHIVLFSHLSREILDKNNFALGNYKDPTPDIKIQSKEEIHKFVQLIKNHLQKTK
jgi:hypothetical protein